jgi:phospholipase/lecithinase/hemolysin
MVLNMRRALSGLVLCASALCAAPAMAGPYSSLVIFGDSLSDTGNLFLATGGTQPPAGQPYYNGRFSDGPVWVETLAAQLGLAANAAPSLAGGNNYAFAGARLGTGNNPPGLLAQEAGLWAPTHPVADPNALYVVVGGGNDMRDARSAYQTNSAADVAGRQAAAAAAAQELFNDVAFLASRGARHVLISNLPDLGATPEAALLGLVAASSDVTQLFNALVGGLEASLEGLFTGLDVDMLDMAGLSANVRANGAAFGITNVTAPCAGFAFSQGAACSASLFSDALHPSAVAHALIGQAAYLLVVPLPGSLWLAGIALLALRLTPRSRRAA